MILTTVEMKAYSQDLRDRVISLHKTSKYRIKAISDLLGIERHTISNWIRRYKENGDYSSRQHLQSGRDARFTNKENIIEFLANNPDSRAIDIRDAIAPELPMSTFYDTLHRMKITYKKEPKYKGRDEEARKQFVEYIDQIASDKLVYCDEMGVSNNTTMLYGWSERGTRAYSEQAGFATERVNIVAGYNKGTKELIAPLEHSGYIDKQLFNQWVGELLCPSLKPGQCVIMDNASIHKSPLVKELIENAGCTLIYLPVYSPDLNSIEHCWANFKNYLRKIIKNFKDFRDAITAAMVKTFPG